MVSLHVIIIIIITQQQETGWRGNDIQKAAKACIIKISGVYGMPSGCRMLRVTIEDCYLLLALGVEQQQAVSDVRTAACKRVMMAFCKKLDSISLRTFSRTLVSAYLII